MGKPNITMPHRHTVRYEEEGKVIEFEVELLQEGIAFYRNTAKIVSGDARQPEAAAHEVENWLRSKFDHVEVDLS